MKIFKIRTKKVSRIEKEWKVMKDRNFLGEQEKYEIYFLYVMKKTQRQVNMKC